MTPKEPKINKLTKAEKEVLELITVQFLTPKQIEIRRQCSRQAVNKVINKLKLKGALNTGLQKVDKIEGLVNQNLVRLHGQEFNIRILLQTPKYQKELKKSNILFIDGHTVKLYRNSLEIYAGEGTSFYGDDAQEALAKSLIYWKKFITRLENDLNTILIKPRTRNVRIVNQHFARGNSEIAYNAIENKKKIKVFAQEDGKLAFISDDSFGFKEDETVHPKTSKPDREAIDKQVNDWRLKNPPTNSELASNIQGLITVQEYHAENIKTHIGAIQKLGTAVEDLTQLIKDLDKKRNV